jgi:regulator of protease activity HflC (stomatin/prohibitin superfamily)
MDWRRVFRVLLEPAKDPLRDSFGISVERVRELRIRLSEQLAELRSRARAWNDPGFAEQIRQLQAEHDRLLQAERRVNGELDAHHAAKALQHLQDLMIVLDDAHARAAALAETLYRDE